MKMPLFIKRFLARIEVRGQEDGQWMLLAEKIWWGYYPTKPYDVSEVMLRTIFWESLVIPFEERKD